MKKFLAGFFTLALVLSLATGAFAEASIQCGKAPSDPPCIEPE